MRRVMWVNLHDWFFNTIFAMDAYHCSSDKSSKCVEMNVAGR
jgi:hypothetical protein